MQYEFDLTLYIFRMLPTFLRKAKMLAWMYVLLKPLEVIFDAFVAKTEQYNLEATYNSQTLNLAWLLNEKFDKVQRRIKIINNNDTGFSVSAYLLAEAQPRTNAYKQGEGPKALIGTYEEFSLLDFYVSIPADLVAIQTAIAKLVDKYKLGGKQYEFIVQ